MTTYTKLKAIDNTIKAMQHLQSVYFQELTRQEQKISDETISYLLKEKQYLEDKLKQEDNIAKKSLNYLKALFN
tara:strand:- start:29 stop:250 length:222 start_codon:yes stop_codon:yes gene_type:complete